MAEYADTGVVDEDINPSDPFGDAHRTPSDRAFVADIELDDHKVSRKHAEIGLYGPEAYVLRDLRGPDGELFAAEDADAGLIDALFRPVDVGHGHHDDFQSPLHFRLRWLPLPALGPMSIIGVGASPVNPRRMPDKLVRAAILVR